jgi:hypothetical protein
MDTVTADATVSFNTEEYGEIVMVVRIGDIAYYGGYCQYTVEVDKQTDGIFNDVGVSSAVGGRPQSTPLGYDATDGGFLGAPSMPISTTVWADANSGEEITATITAAVSETQEISSTASAPMPPAETITFDLVDSPIEIPTQGVIPGDDAVLKQTADGYVGRYYQYPGPDSPPSTEIVVDELRLSQTYTSDPVSFEADVRGVDVGHGGDPATRTVRVTAADGGSADVSVTLAGGDTETVTGEVAASTPTDISATIPDRRYGTEYAFQEYEGVGGVSLWNDNIETPQIPEPHPAAERWASDRELLRDVLVYDEFNIAYSDAPSGITVSDYGFKYAVRQWQRGEITDERMAIIHGLRGVDIADVDDLPDGNHPVLVSWVDNKVETGSVPSGVYNDDGILIDIASTERGASAPPTPKLAIVGPGLFAQPDDSTAEAQQHVERFEAAAEYRVLWGDSVDNYTPDENWDGVSVAYQGSQQVDPSLVTFECSTTLAESQYDSLPSGVVAADENATATTTVTFTDAGGGSGATIDVVVKLAGQRQTETLSFTAGETKTREYSFALDTPGEYTATVSIQDRSA